MANVIDEMTGPVNTQGRDINVIEKQIPVKTGFGSVLFEFFLWFPFILPGLIFLLMKIGARNYFKALEQKISTMPRRLTTILNRGCRYFKMWSAWLKKQSNLTRM